MPKDVDLLAEVDLGAQCGFCQCAALVDLRKVVARLEQEQVLLKEEIASQIHASAVMRDVMTKSRVSGSPFVGTRSLRNRLKKMACAFFPVDRAVKKLARCDWGPRVGSNPSKYISQSALESLILRTARQKVYDVRGVIIEFDLSGTRPSNWHVSGVVSGRAERSAAVAAVEHAARENASWVMVEDGSRLEGRSVKLTSTSRQPS